MAEEVKNKLFGIILQEPLEEATFADLKAIKDILNCNIRGGFIGRQPVILLTAKTELEPAEYYNNRLEMFERRLS